MVEPDEVLLAAPRVTSRVVLVSAIYAAAVVNVIVLLDLAGHGELTRWFVPGVIALAIGVALVRGWMLARRQL
jgi:flagellar biosynthesis protein FliQ